jgi:hypothetical protein
VVLLTGKGIDADLSCRACADLQDRPTLLSACGGCLEWVEEYGGCVGVRGTPEIRERPEPIDARLDVIELPGELAGLLDIQPVVAAPGSVWVALTDELVLYRLDLDTGEHERLCEVPATLAPPTEPLAASEARATFTSWASLRVSRDGGLAAVAETHGQRGAVVDLTTGRLTLPLDRGNYHVQHYGFSCALITRGGRDLVVHATAWNRLDVSDARTGEPLTERGPTVYRRDEPRPAHYLDYFHALLVPSPDGRWIADNGWVWAPVGVVTTWSLDAWLEGNVWESEDGPLFCDQGRLFGSAADGLGIWDPRTGERLARIQGFSPTRQHPAARELVEIQERRLTRWRLAPRSEAIAAVGRQA